MVKSSLQYQLAVALGIEKPAPTRTIHSAGARPISVPDRRTPTGSTGKGRISHHFAMTENKNFLDIGLFLFKKCFGF
jgi:hypothetical protein